MSHELTETQRFFFENNGYLVIENFLAAPHVASLREALAETMEKRRELETKGLPQTGMTQIHGERSTRIFYILADHPRFLELLDWQPMLPYVTGLLNKMPHHHASDAIVEHGTDLMQRPMGWHIDGHDEGYRNLRPIPLLQLKIGYYLTDMTDGGQGNLWLIPGSHKATRDPSHEKLRYPYEYPGALEVCAPAGSAMLFHNALWHSAGIFTKPDGCREMLYYAYEHPWMIASQEHWGYPKAFYNDTLSPAQRKFFHGFVFNPPEQRWG